jgi:hypothetical protein
MAVQWTNINSVGVLECIVICIYCMGVSLHIVTVCVCQNGHATSKNVLYLYPCLAPHLLYVLTGYGHHVCLELSNNNPQQPQQPQQYLLLNIQRRAALHYLRVGLTFNVGVDWSGYLDKELKGRFLSLLWDTWRSLGGGGKS